MNWKTRFKLSAAFAPMNAAFRGWRRIQWRLGGAALPPPHEIKQARLLRLRRRYRPRALVETGTYRGKMVFAMRPHFDRVVSIEIDPALGEGAQRLFADTAAVEVLIGDSARLLPRVLADLAEPTLFWLDGHYSGGGTGRGDTQTPILAELDAILAHPVAGHVIAIDDALCFDGRNDYPTLDALRRSVAERAGGYRVEVVENMILLTPPPAAAAHVADPVTRPGIH